MKKGMLLIILLFCVSFVVAQPPSFHVFSGYVSCEEFDGHLTDYSISATIYGDNISSSFQGEINGGEYVIFVDDSKFNCSEECGVNFVVSGENFVGTNYSSMGFDIFNITLSAEHSLCSSGTVCEDGTCEGDETCSSCPADCGTCPTTGGGPTGGSTSDDECGDDEVNQDDEECDGIDLEDKTCAIVGFDSGDLSCYDNCTFDSSACVGTGPECGNGLKEYGEACDSEDIALNSCSDLGFDYGVLSCSDCSYDISECFYEIENNETGVEGDPTELALDYSVWLIIGFAVIILIFITLSIYKKYGYKGIYRDKYD